MGGCSNRMPDCVRGLALKLILAAVLCGRFSPALAWAESEQTLTMWSRVPPMERVTRSYIVAADASQVVAVAPLTYLEAPQGKDATLVGRLRVDAEHSPLRLLFSTMNSEGEVRSVYRECRPEELSMVARLSTNQLRDRFVERRGVLRQLQASVSALETRLATLQEDADAIANVNKLVNAEDELRDVQSSLERVREAQREIQGRVALLGARPQPLNAQRRQADLVKQLAEFSTALTKTESGALKRMQSASSDLQLKLRDIEETKDEHVGLLEEELAQAKRERKADSAAH